MSLNNPNDQKRYVFPARAVQALQADAEGNVGKTLSLHWRQFIEAAKGRAPIDEETIYALELFSQIQFRLSAEVWGNFEGLLARAENRSGQSGAFVFSDGTPAYEADAELYFDALYASKNTSSQTPAHTLRMIAKYLFAVRNLPVDRAFRFATNSNDGVIPPQPHHELHLKALDRIWVHWNAWRAAEKASEQVEYAQVPEAPIQPAEPLEAPDMDVLMRRAFAEFEEGKPLTEAGRAICDAFGLREVYEEQLKDPKNRAILAIGETLLRTVQSVLRPSAPPEKPFVMSAPPEGAARPRTPADPPAATLMSDVVKDMIERQQHAEKMAEINAAYRQRDEQIRQAKAIADAECQDALERINRGYAKGEEGVWLPLVGHAQQAYAPPDAWEGFRKQALNGDKHLAQILAELKAKADEQHELSEKIREQFAGKGDDPIEKLRKRIVYGKNNDN